MTLFLSNVLLAVAWMALTGQFTETNFLLGYAVGYVILWLTQRTEASTVYFTKMRQVTGFSLYFLWELVKANIRVAHDVLTPRHRMTPGIIAVPLDAKTDAEITFLANLITLTPGTLSLDVSEDKRVLYIHAMYVRDVYQFKREVKEGLERRLLEVVR